MNMKDYYAIKSLSQIPRILGNMDRNPFSPTYGCCHRDFWLDKTTDFPDAVRQFGIQALAIVYKHKFKGNNYYNIFMVQLFFMITSSTITDNMF